jgi:hypothetical protein
MPEPISDAGLGRFRHYLDKFGDANVVDIYGILARLDAVTAERDRLLRELAGAESRAEDANNAGAEEAARRLREVAGRGRSGGTFGGAEVEAAARAVDALRAERDRLWAALLLLLGGAGGEWGSRYAHADGGPEVGHCPWCCVREPGPHQEDCEGEAARAALGGGDA